MKEKRQNVVMDFKYKGRRCVVIEIDRAGQMNLSREMLEGPCSSMYKPYCNGYVELKKEEVKKHYNDYNIESDELTYQGTLNFPKLNSSDGKMYIGFDSAHYWNDENPESKTKEYVANTCRKIVDELENS